MVKRSEVVEVNDCKPLEEAIGQFIAKSYSSDEHFAGTLMGELYSDVVYTHLGINPEETHRELDNIVEFIEGVICHAEKTLELNGEIHKADSVRLFIVGLMVNQHISKQAGDPFNTINWVYDFIEATSRIDKPEELAEAILMPRHDIRITHSGI